MRAFPLPGARCDDGGHQGHRKARVPFRKHAGLTTWEKGYQEPSRMLNGISVDGERIAIRAPYAYKDAIKELPGATWSKARGVWQLPATPSAAHNVMQLFAGKPIPQSDSFKELASRYVNVEASNARKYAEQLPPVPNEKQVSWLHQKQAFHYAFNMPASMLDMGMGTGKTKVVVDLVREWKCKRTLIICPNSVVRVWPKEFRKHGVGSGRIMPLEVGSVAAKRDKVAQQLKLPDASPLVVVLGYDSSWREPMDKVLEHTEWDCVILDESHKAKSASGKRGKFIEGLYKNSTHRLCLTGTPMPHDILDAFSQYRFLDPGIFGKSFTIFKRKYAELGGYKGYEVKGWQNEDDFQKRFDSICYHVSSDVLDLPETQHIEIEVSLGAKALKHYNELEQEFITEVKAGTVTVANALVKGLRLHQITSGYLPIDDDVRGTREIERIDDAKEQALFDLLEALPTLEPVVVFCLFKEDIEVVKRVSEQLGRRFDELSGRRNGLTSDATMPEGVDTLAVQIQSGGVGIDLTRAAYAVYYSVGYNSGDYEQSLRRIHRPGQTRPSFYYHLIAAGTVDVDIYAANASKASAVQRILKRYKGEIE